MHIDMHIDEKLIQCVYRKFDITLQLFVGVNFGNNSTKCHESLKLIRYINMRNVLTANF